MTVFVLTVGIEISDQMGTSETRIIGSFSSREKAIKAQEELERNGICRWGRTYYKITQTELDAAADWGAA